MEAPILQEGLLSELPDPESLWAEYLPRLTVFVRAFGGAAANSAEDVAQDIIERAIGAVHRFDGVHVFSTWLYRLARNRCIDVARTATRRRDIRSRHRHSLQLVHPVEPGPEERLELDETAAEVSAAIGRLKPIDRQLAFLRYFEELPIARIAEVMEMPVGTVKYRLHVLVGRLRAELEEKLS